MTMIQQQQQMGGAGAAVGKSNGNGQADTSLTKIFVGGLAWETKKETMKKYFEQFGDIQEAVVIMDKNTGRSKGYGFVTFKDADSARKACADPAPVIDGRRANCNLASLGASRSRPSPPPYGNRFRSGPHFQGASQSGMPAYNGGMAFPHPAPYQYQQGYPYSPYGFPAYAPDFSFAQGYYNPYAAAAQFPQIYHAGPAAAAMCPPHAQGAGGGYMQGTGTGTGPHIVHYSSSPGLVATSAPSVPAPIQTSGVPLTGASSEAINRSPRQTAAQHYAISMPLPQYAAVAVASEPTAT